ncbi:MAG: helix-turn-helix transcriptional regulator [Lachnospiraceae bacterium]|nr:helix-turn-helix transcriptional regulator [Lachnospiraceae bacterium]
MKQTSTNEIGKIIDKNGNQLLRMWNVEVPCGKRPLQHHQHFNFEIMYVNSGNGTYTTKNKDYPISAGDLFVFSSNEFHCITDVGHEGLRITNLHFNPQFIWNNTSDSNTNINMNFCFSHHPDFSNRIAADAKGPMSLLLQLQTELEANEKECHLCVRALLHLLLVSLVRNYNYLDTQSSISHQQLHSIQHTLHYIDKHFTEKITLQELSALAGLTPTYFSTFFKQVVGISLWNYINYKRIDMAIRLITSDGLRKNMIDIAAECGFNNTANFNKTFKQITGMTPSDYKKNGGVVEIS